MKLMDRLGTMSSLPENGLYVFRIVVSNTIGSITTDDLEICRSKLLLQHLLQK